jgi:hypothetical protein
MATIQLSCARKQEYQLQQRLNPARDLQQSGNLQSPVLPQHKLYITYKLMQRPMSDSN